MTQRKVAVLLHGAAVMRGPQPLHAADAHLIRAWRGLDAEITVVELLGAGGVTPRAIDEAIEAGAAGAVRIVAEPLAAADSHATGLVAERCLRGLEPDLILFTADADPEGLADVPAVIAWRLGAAYVPGVTEIAEVATSAEVAASAGAASGGSTLEVVTVRAGRVVRLALPTKAVVGFDVDGIVTGAADATAGAPPPVAASAPRLTQAIRIITLPDLGLEPTLVRRGDDLRGVIEEAPRPLVTTRSVESLVTLLR